MPPDPLKALTQMAGGGGMPHAASQPMAPQPGMPLQAVQSMTPLMPQSSPLQGNPLMALASKLIQQPQQQQRPAPTRAQTVAATYRFTAVRQAMQQVMDDPNFGKTNLRPKVLDAASKLLGSKIVSLPDIMNTIKDLPDDPLKQKEFVLNVFNSAGQARDAVLDMHRNAQFPEGQEQGEWDDKSHAGHIDALMNNFKK